MITIGELMITDGEHMTSHTALVTSIQTEDRTIYIILELIKKK